MLRQFTVLMKQTRQAVRAIKQSIFLDVYETNPSNIRIFPTDICFLLPHGTMLKALYRCRYRCLPMLDGLVSTHPWKSPKKFVRPLRISTTFERPSNFFARFQSGFEIFSQPVFISNSSRSEEAVLNHSFTDVIFVIS